VNIKATAIGVLVGMLLGGPAAVQAYDKVQPKHDIVGEGYWVDCRGNGDGGYRRCDIHIIEKPGAPVHRFDVNQYSNNTFEIGIVSWGYNGGRHPGDGTGQSDESVDDYVQSRVVR
jgi:hypothetical protein